MFPLNYRGLLSRLYTRVIGKRKFNLNSAATLSLHSLRFDGDAYTARVCKLGAREEVTGGGGGEVRKKFFRGSDREGKIVRRDSLKNPGDRRHFGHRYVQHR